MRHHHNEGGYRGERIDIRDVLERVARAAAAAGWATEEIARQGDHAVSVFLKTPAPSVDSLRRIYISAGIHGDEPATTLATLQLIEDNQWPAQTELIVFPCLNPVGIERNRREGPEGHDLNRDYRTPRTAVVKAHRQWLRDQPNFDVAMLLHEDWEADGFYLYELCVPTARPAGDKVVSAVSSVCPILEATRADDWPAKNGIVRPVADPARRAEWPEALHLFLEKADLCYTFEAPSDYDLSTRVAALVEAVHATVDHVLSEGHPTGGTGDGA